MASIFSKIVSGEIPSHKIGETDDFLAFLDISPLVKGHTLVIPKDEIDYFYDLEDEMMIRLMLFSKRIARAIQAAIPCQRIGISVIGLEVPHTHVHLIPINTIDDMNFSREKLEINQEELAEIAEKIRRFYY